MSSLPIPASPHLTSELLVGGAELIDSLREEWSALCRESEHDSPFLRPEYFQTYLRHFEPGEHCIFAAVREEGVLIGLMALVRVSESWSGIPVRVLTSPRGEHYPRFDVLSRAGVSRTAVCALLADRLATDSDWDLIRLSDVAEGSIAFDLRDPATRLGWSVRMREKKPVPHIAINGWNGGWDWYLSTRPSGNFRHMVRRCKRNAERKGDLQVQIFDTADEKALATFYEVESSGWKGESNTAIQCHSHLREFYREAAVHAANQGYFRLYILELNGQAIAAGYGFELGGIFYFAKTGYDIRFKEFAPGHLLLNAMLKDCAERGLRDFDFLGEWMSWKAFWTDTAVSNSDLFIFRNRFFPRLAELLHFRVRPGLANAYRALSKRFAGDKKKR